MASQLLAAGSSSSDPTVRGICQPGAIQARRLHVLDQAYTASPIRFQAKRPLTPRLPAKVWINQPRAAIETQETQQANPAA
jgi:hypothetical protein